jgi:hypothetical protein
MFPNICSTYARMHCSIIKQHDCRSVVDGKRTNDNIRSFLCFFHGNKVESPTSIVLLGSNRNRVGSTGRGRCSCSGLISMSARIGASVGIMSLFTTVEAPTISLWQVLGSLGPLNILTSISRSLEFVGVRNHLTLQGRKSMSSGLQPRLELRLSRMEHRSSGRCSNTWSGVTA